MQLAVDHPDRVQGRDGADLAACWSSSSTPRVAAGAIDVADTRRAAALMQQTVMYSWFGNRLAESARQRLTAEDDLGVLPPRPRAA